MQLALLLVVMLPILLAESVLSYQRYEQRRIAEYQNNLEVARAIASAFEIYVSDILHHELSMGAAIAASGSPTDREISELLARDAGEFPSIINFSWSSPRGIVLASNTPIAIGVDISTRKYFLQLMAGAETSVSDLLNTGPAGSYFFNISRAVRGPDGSLQGIITAVVDSERLGEAIPMERAGQATIAITDSQGRAVYRYPTVPMSWEEREWVKNQPPLIAALNGAEATGTIRSTIDGQTRMAGIVPIRRIGWTAGATRTEEEGMGPVVQDLQREVAVLALIILAALTVARYISGLIVNPLGRLREQALAISRGEMGQRFREEGPQELRELGTAFNRMGEEIGYRARQGRELMAELRRANEQLLAASTKHQALAEQAESSRQRVSHLLESIGDAFLAVDEDWILTYVNSEAEGLLQKPRTELLGKRLWDEISMPWDAPARAALHWAMIDQLPIGFETYFDTTRSWIGARAYPSRDGLSVFFQDISDRKKVEQELLHERDLLKGILEASPYPVLLMGLDGTIQDCNEATLEQYGTHDKDRLVGANAFDLVSEEDRPRAMQSIAQILATGKVKYLDYSVLKADGTEYPSEISVGLVRDSKEKPSLFVVVIDDVTERRRLEERLLRAQRLETAGRVAGQVAHDFNNLLSPMTAYPDLIKMKVPDNPILAQYCDSMIEAARRMAEINEDMLALGRRGHFEEQPVDLNLLAQQAVAHIFDVPATLMVETELNADLPPAMGSSAQLLRVISNLISNAREAMQDSGQITLKTENVYVDQPFGSYNRVEVGEYDRLTISDTGCGIAPEIRDRIFDAFFTTKTLDRRRGCGLGLSVVQSIVEDHRGYLDLESEPGQGTAFSVYLPAYRGTMVEEASSKVPRGNERVLIVDDDNLQLEVASSMLQALGYVVSTASNGEQALEKLRDQPADLLILDMIMPDGMDGTETYRRVLEIAPHQRAIVMSGFSESERVQEAISLGVGRYLRKPVRLESLALAVREELDRQQ